MGCIADRSRRVAVAIILVQYVRWTLVRSFAVSPTLGGDDNKRRRFNNQYRGRLSLYVSV